MATPGVKADISKESIVSTLKECKGIISKSAKKLDVSESYLRKRIKEWVDVVELLADLRHNFEELLLDMAENCVASAMSNQKEDPGNALKSSMFVLNSRGAQRNWSNTLANVGPVYSEIDIQNKDMIIAALLGKLSKYEPIHNESKAESELSGSDTPF